MPMKVVYDLHDDRCTIESLQRSGYQMRGELVGSNEWWEGIGRGQIPTHIVEGKINKIWSGGENDEPEFGIVDSTGECFQWLYPSWDQEVPHALELELNEQVEISYVEREPEVPIDRKLMSPVLLRIRVKIPWAVIF